MSRAVLTSFEEFGRSVLSKSVPQRYSAKPKLTVAAVEKHVKKLLKLRLRPFFPKTAPQPTVFRLENMIQVNFVLDDNENARKTNPYNKTDYREFFYLKLGTFLFGFLRETSSVH